ncbi:MAG: hypothetical protein OXD54_01810 [Candidatus Poribacteria bacterium]|nr:hypothetical protein [Candidatus Poribacteria bacterium]
MMKTLRVFTILTSAFILLISCATHTPTEKESFSSNESSSRRGMHSWKGQHISEVIKKWGPPHKVVDQNSGGEIYTWKFNAATTTFPDGHLRGRKGTIQPIINLYTYKDGIVYHWTSDAGSRVDRPR